MQHHTKNRHTKSPEHWNLARTYSSLCSQTSKDPSSRNTYIRLETSLGLQGYLSSKIPVSAKPSNDYQNLSTATSMKLQRRRIFYDRPSPQSQTNTTFYQQTWHKHIRTPKRQFYLLQSLLKHIGLNVTDNRQRISTTGGRQHLKTIKFREVDFALVLGMKKSWVDRY